MQKTIDRVIAVKMHLTVLIVCWVKYQYSELSLSYRNSNSDAVTLMWGFTFRAKGTCTTVSTLYSLEFEFKRFRP